MKKQFMRVLALAAILCVTTGCDKEKEVNTTTAEDLNIIETTAAISLTEETTAGREVLYGQITVEGNSVIGGPSQSVAQYGNTLGNLINSGIVCESADKIFYYNKSDNKKLYVMNKDGSDKSAVGNVQGAMELNAIGDYVYYQAGGIYRVKIKDGTTETLVSSDCHNMVVTESAIYYIKKDNDVNKVHKMNHDGSEQVILSDNLASGLNVCDDKVFYINGMDSGRIYSMNSDGSDNVNVVSTKNVQELLVEGDWIYYVSGSNDGNHVYIAAAAGGEDVIKIIDDSCSNININGGLLYYYNASEDALCYSALDGSSQVVLFSGKLNAVNVISDWVYFFNTDDFQYYRITKDGNNIEVVN